MKCEHVEYKDKKRHCNFLEEPFAVQPSNYFRCFFLSYPQWQWSVELQPHLCCCSPAEVLGTNRFDTWRWPQVLTSQAEASVPHHLHRRHRPHLLACRPPGFQPCTAPPRSAFLASGPSTTAARHTWRSSPGCVCSAPAGSWPGCPASSDNSTDCRRCGGRQGVAWVAAPPRRLSSDRCAAGAAW